MFDQSHNDGLDTISVLVVDDHPLVRQGIETFINIQPDITVVASAENAEQGINASIEYAPDVILMDINLGDGMNGIDASRQIKQHSPQSAIIILSSYHGDEYIFPAIKAGALSYLLKDVAPEALANGIRQAAQRRAVLAPKVAQRIVEEMQPSKHEQAHLPSPLSDRELQVLSLIAQGMNNQEISQQLFITVKTVRCHVSNILSKLHLRDRTQAAIHAWQKGLV